MVTSQLQGVSVGMWIGMFRRDPETDWEWQDNMEANFKNWAPSQPFGDTVSKRDYMTLCNFCCG